MEHEIHSVYSLFWRNAYVAALQAGHPDPAAAADEAFMAFDCRFGEVEPAPLKPAVTYTMTFVDVAGVEHLTTDPPTEGLPTFEWKSDDEVLG